MRGTEHSPRQPDTQTRVLLFRPSVGALTELPLGAELRGGEPAGGPARRTGLEREERARRHFRWGRGRGSGCGDGPAPPRLRPAPSS